MATNPLVRTLGGLGIGAAALSAGTIAALTSRRHALAEETGETYEPGPCVVHDVTTDDGVRLHVEVSEPEGTDWQSRPTVVLSHGYTLSCQSWIFVRRRLAEAGYRVVAWDQRGHGKSANGPAEGYTIRRLGKDLKAVIDAQVALGDMVLVGHSMGGMTQMALGAQEPELVRERVVGVAFVATSAGGTGELQVQLGDALGRFAQRVGPAVLTPLGERPGVVAAARRGARELEDAITYRYSYASPVPRTLLRFTADMILATPMDVMAAWLAPLSLHDEHEGLAAFGGIETLVLNGTDDLLTPPRHSDEIVRVLPHAEHVLVHHAGHLVMLEHPALVADQVIALAERGVRRPVQQPRRRGPVEFTDLTKRRAPKEPASRAQGTKGTAARAARAARAAASSTRTRSKAPTSRTRTRTGGKGTSA